MELAPMVAILTVQAEDTQLRRPRTAEVAMVDMLAADMSPVNIPVQEHKSVPEGKDVAQV